MTMLFYGFKRLFLQFNHHISIQPFMAQLVLENMEFYAYHGHFAEENIVGGRFSVDVVLETNVDLVSVSDNLEDAVDYGRVYELVKREMGQVSRLLEHVVKRIVDAIQGEFKQVEKITVTVSKLNPPVGGKMDRFSVTLTR
jgi:dihydroneopterin aldolase